MPRKILILGFLFLLTSCSSIRMKYEATVVDDLFQTAQFEYYKSYDVAVWTIGVSLPVFFLVERVGDISLFQTK